MWHRARRHSDVRLTLCASAALRSSDLGVRSRVPKSAKPPGLSAKSWRYGVDRE
jgi:hypothetical protein